MEKQSAINILEDIQESLNGNNGKERALKTIDIYRKNLEVSTSQKIRKLIDKQKEYVQKYGENGRKTIKLNKKINDEIHKIFNN